MSGGIPKEIRLFRMVHYENLEHLLRNGLCCKDHENADPDYINIGDNGLIASRNEFEVPIPPGGKLGDYVPFYFAGHSPMLLNIKTGFRGVTKRPQHEIVFVVCKLKDVLAHCKQFVYTDGHAKDRLTDFYNDIGIINDVIRWDMVSLQYWAPTEEHYDSQRCKQAEFLVKKEVPVTCIEGILVKNDDRKLYVEKILQKLHLQLPVGVDFKNKYYYP
jgi:hypothetical protein